MPELRLNLITREWVVVQCERARKPEDFRLLRERRYQPQLDPNCPFCPGNESKTPEELMRVPSADGSWKVRVTPNKYPALLSEGEPQRVNEAHKHLVTGVGRHEVIIESPLHNTSPATMETDDYASVLEVYRARFTDTFNDDRVEHAIIFKNHGPSAGTTIMHPHTQLIGIPVTPIGVRNRMDEAMRFFDNTGECLMCAIMKEDLAEDRRIVVETDGFVVFIPYAALSPFHTWIVPKRHMASFSDCTDREIHDLAYTLKTVLLKLHHGLDDPDYNYMIYSRGPFRYRSEYVHWYISLVPRLVPTAGFEMGSGIYINRAIPEEVAAFMRSVKVS